jgi:DNA-binding beta-propeller fold protein YncE
MATGNTTVGPSSGQAGGADPVLARLHLPPVAPGAVLPGYLLIADRENNRIIIVSPGKRAVWGFPSATGAGVDQQFIGPDDAFLTPDGQSVTTNEEDSGTIGVVSLSPHPRIIWRYGHQGVPGSEPGYLYHPDDAYMLPNGLISVADIVNCRVIWLDRAKRIVRQLGTTGGCEHRPPGALDLPNGDTPLPDGGVLVTEIGGWIDRFDASGHLVWSIKTPSEYPSDAQLLPEGKVLVAGYNEPGEIYVIDPHDGRVTWSYGPASGPEALDHPSLALLLPNGMIAATDDWHDRVVIINRATKRIVWQYGHDGVSGSAAGYLNVPDGLDLVP